MTKEEIVEKFLKFAKENHPVMADILAGLAEGFDSGKITREEIFKEADKVRADADAIRAAVGPILDEALRIGSAELADRSVLQAAAESIEANSAEYVPPVNPLDHWGEEHWETITALFKACEELRGLPAHLLGDVAPGVLAEAITFADSGAIDILKEWTPIKDRWNS